MKNVALYIHIPFCKQKCLYCDFPSFAGKEDCMLDYAAALAKEINSIKDKKNKNYIYRWGNSHLFIFSRLGDIKKKY